MAKYYRRSKKNNKTMTNKKFLNKNKTKKYKKKIVGGNINELLPFLNNGECTVKLNTTMPDFYYECNEKFNLEENDDFKNVFGELKKNDGKINAGSFDKHPNYFVLKKPNVDKDKILNYYLLKKIIEEKQYKFTPFVEKIIKNNEKFYIFFDKLDGDLFNLLYYTIPYDILMNDMNLSKEEADIYYNFLYYLSGSPFMPIKGMENIKDTKEELFKILNKADYDLLNKFLIKFLEIQSKVRNVFAIQIFKMFMKFRNLVEINADFKLDNIGYKLTTIPLTDIGLNSYNENIKIQVNSTQYYLYIYLIDIDDAITKLNNIYKEKVIQQQINTIANNSKKQKLSKRINKYKDRNNTNIDFIFDLINTNSTIAQLTFSNTFIFRLENFFNESNDTDFINPKLYQNLVNILNKLINPNDENINFQFKKNTEYEDEIYPYVVYFNDNKYIKSIFEELEIDDELKSQIMDYKSKTEEEKELLLKQIDDKINEKFFV